MLTNQPDSTERSRRSCASYGCISVLVVILAIAAWIGSGFVFWQQCRIPLPDKSGSVVYVARLNKIFCAEWNRKVRIETNRFPGRYEWVPGDPCGAWPVNVYWYPAKNGTGPYVRFHDPIYEYLVDLKRGVTLLVVRPGGDNAYVGSMSSDGPWWESSGDPATREYEVIINGHPARRLEDRVASSPGRYLGRIDHPRYGFVSAKEEPEKALPEH